MGQIGGVHNQDIVCVLGMHRSGTSLLTRILNLLGVDLGSYEFLTTEPVAANPKGYWEHRELTAINDAILKKHGGSWDNPPLLTPGWETAASLDDLKNQAQKLIRDQFATASLWAWKDPRSCLTLPFWQQLFPNMRYIVCLRNPVDVARSLESRDNFSFSKSSNLWFTYVSSALNHSGGKPRLVVFYEDVVDDCLRELRRLAEFLGEPERAEPVDVQEAVQEFVETGLQHYRVPIEEALANPRIDSRARALYLAQRISVSLGRKSGPQVLDNEIYKTLNSLTQHSFQAPGDAKLLIEQLAKAEDQLADTRETNRVFSTRILDTENQLQRITEAQGWRLLNRYGRIKHRFVRPIQRLLGFIRRAQIKPGNENKPAATIDEHAGGV